MKETDNIESKKARKVKRGSFIKKKAIYRYLKGKIHAKYSGKILDSTLFSGNANSINNIIDLVFFTHENDVFETEPRFKEYENSKNLLGLFNFPGTVKVAIEENESSDLEKKVYYEIDYEKIQLIKSFDNKNIEPYRAIYHQKEEKEELGTFTGNAILTKKFVELKKYHVEIIEGLPSKLILFNDQKLEVDELEILDSGASLYQHEEELFLKTDNAFYNVSCEDENLKLLLISEKAKAPLVVPRKKLWIDELGFNEPIIKEKTVQKARQSFFEGSISVLGWIINLLSFGFILMLIFGLVYFFWNEAPVIGLILIGIFCMSWIGSIMSVLFNFIGKLFNYIIFPALSLLVIGGVIYALFQIAPNLTKHSSRKYNYAKDDYRESVKQKYQSNGDVFRITRAWNDYNQKEHIISFEVSESALFNSELNKEGLNKQFRAENIGELYKQMAKDDLPHLDDLKDKLTQLKTDQNLTDVQFAQLIMSFIQDFPYSLVLSNNCQDPINKNQGFIKSYLEDGGTCIGNEKFGVLTPLEFVCYARGDCDSRTTFAFGLLKDFGFDVAIFNSVQYAHSILGISFTENNIIGAFKQSNKKKYYLWETTSVGFDIGNIPSDQMNMNFWLDVTSEIY